MPLCCVLLYAAILLGIWLIGSWLENRGIKESVGSLEERFAPEVTLEYEGDIWTYRSGKLTNILLIGTDWADLEQPEANADRYDGQADFLLLVTLDHEQKCIMTLPIDRDTIVPVRVYGAMGDYAGEREMQICLSYAYGENRRENAQNTVWSVSRLLGSIPIDEYIVMDTGAIAAINDGLGGVEVTLEEDMTVLDPQMEKGKTICLTGKQAEFYVRGRTGIGDETNRSRMMRQQAFIRAANDKLMQRLGKDADFAADLYDAVSEHLMSSMQGETLLDRLYASRAYQRKEPEGIAGTHRIGEDGFIEFLYDEQALNGLLAENYFEREENRPR